MSTTTMPIPRKPPPKSRRRLFVYLALGFLALLVVGSAVGYWFVVPRVAENLVRQQLARVEAKLGFDVEVEEIHTSGWQGVVMDSLQIRDPESGEALVTIGQVRASLDKAQLLSGDKAISSVSLRDVDVYLHRRLDGALNVDDLLARLRGGDSEDDDGDETKDEVSDADAGRRMLRHFGGTWPELEVHNATLHLQADGGAEPWPVDGLTTALAKLTPKRDAALFTTTIDIIHSKEQGRFDPRWTLPRTMEVATTLRFPLTYATTEIDFEPALEIVDLPQVRERLEGQFGYLRGGIGGLSIKTDHVIELRRLSLGLQPEQVDHRILALESLSVQLAEWTRDLEQLRVLEVSVIGPTVDIMHNSEGGNTLETLHHLVRAPHARSVVTQATLMATEIAEKLAEETEAESAAALPTPPQPATQAQRRGLRERLRTMDWRTFVTERSPQNISVTGAVVRVSDKRQHPTLMRPSSMLTLGDGQFKIAHRPLRSELNLEGGFTATADRNQPRGSASLEVSTNYRSGAIKLDANVNGLDLSWLSQLLGPRLARRVYGGTARVKLEFERPAKKVPITFSGLASIDEATLHLSPIAEDPMRDLSTSYQFEGTLDFDAAIPAPKLMRTANTGRDLEPVFDIDGDEEEIEVDPGAPPTRGALVFKKGIARFNGVKADFLPSIYGIDGRKMPARLDLSVRLPETPLPDLVSAVPEPIQGPIAGVQLKGTFEWELDLELPLYLARDMEWETRPKLKNFEVVSMPHQVNVYKLKNEFQHVIRDSFMHRGTLIEFERAVTIPEMRPIPANWLMENAGRTIEQIDRERRRRGWPLVPEYSRELNIDREVLRSPEYWLTKHALDQATPKPWRDVAAVALTTVLDVDLDEENAPSSRRPRVKNFNQPYGEYQFAPLHHISPWLIRAIMTTEDNSFFTHKGFNWFAVRRSIEANINARGYVRGASTISMQLAKNVFLDRSKVLSRKFQEAFLVWLMESVVDVPKERLLEVYLNVIEYGPGIFGIHDASVHYFGKRPDKLSISEVAWLVSIIPSPKRRHAFYARGEITPSWFRRMTRYIRVMKVRNRITEEQYLAAIDDKPEFYKPTDDEPMFRPPPAIPEPEPEPQPLFNWPEFPDFFR